MNLQSPRSPATVAGRLHKVLPLAVGHVPPLAAMGGRLQEQAAWSLRGLEQALTRLHECLTLLDIAGTSLTGAEDAERVRACTERVAGEAQAFMHKTAAASNTMRPVLVDFLVEFRSIERVVDRGADWMHELDAALASRQPAPASLPLDFVVQRADGLRKRVELLHAVVRSGRNTHALADHLVRTRTKLAETVEGQLRRASALLQKRLQLARPADPAAQRALDFVRSDAQIWTTQALSLLLRLRASQDRLSREAEALRHRCRLVPQPEAPDTPPDQPRYASMSVLRENAASAA